MSLIIPANSAAASGSYAVDNSLRFNRGSSDSLSFTPNSTTNRRTFTISFWTKISEPNVGSVEYGIFNAGQQPNDNGWFNIQQGHTSDGDFMSQFYSGAFRNFKLTQKISDSNAWYHFVVAMDTTQGTNTNRLKYYINGTQVTSFNSPIYPDQNFDTKVSTDGQIQSIGSKRNGSAALVDHFDGYLSEFVMIDGQQLAPDQFGEFDEDSGIWKPIDVSGLTFGDNGYYLEFKQSGTSQNSSGLGADTSGNDNHFSVSNLTAVDQSTDTCTNNFATMNPLDNYYAQATFSEGNLKVATASSPTTYVTSTIGVTPNFKCYWEAKFDTTQSGNGEIGMVDKVTTGASAGGGASRLYYQRNGISVNDSGQVWGNNSNTGQSLGSLSTSDIICFAWDGTNNALYIRKNGDAWVNSGNPASGSSKTGAFVTPDSNITIFQSMADQNGGGSSTASINFGSPPYAISSGNTDGDGYGNFEYAVPSSYYSLNTKNLAEYG